MSEKYGNVTRLGVYQRNIAEALHPVIPMGAEAALAVMKPGAGIDLGYAAATLMRLEERGIAKRYGQSSGFVRGDQWKACAQHYRWSQAIEIGARWER